MFYLPEFSGLEMYQRPPHVSDLFGPTHNIKWVILFDFDIEIFLLSSKIKISNNYFGGSVLKVFLIDINYMTLLLKFDNILQITTGYYENLSSVRNKRKYPYINFVNKTTKFRKRSIIYDMAWAIVIQLIHLIKDFTYFVGVTLHLPICHMH